MDEVYKQLVEPLAAPYIPHIVKVFREDDRPFVQQWLERVKAPVIDDVSQNQDTPRTDISR